MIVMLHLHPICSSASAAARSHANENAGGDDELVHSWPGATMEEIMKGDVHPQWDREQTSIPRGYGFVVENSRDSEDQHGRELAASGGDGKDVWDSRKTLREGDTATVSKSDTRKRQRRLRGWDGKHAIGGHSRSGGDGNNNAPQRKLMAYLIDEMKQRFITGSEMRIYLNDLVDASVAKVENQVSGCFP